jgi:hypothetical protein
MAPVSRVAHTVEAKRQDDKEQVTYLHTFFVMATASSRRREALGLQPWKFTMKLAALASEAVAVATWTRCRDTLWSGC